MKATPAFNLSLCEKFGLKPLEFDGREDSLFHEFAADGHRHMEYLNDRGEYADVPLAEMSTTLRREYAAMFETFDRQAGLDGDFDADVEAESS